MRRIASCRARRRRDDAARDERAAGEALEDRERRALRARRARPAAGGSSARACTGRRRAACITWSEKQIHVVPGAKRDLLLRRSRAGSPGRPSRVVQAEHQVIVLAAPALGDVQRARAPRPRRAACGGCAAASARAIASNGSPTRHTRGSPSGLTLQNTRRMRSPRLGRDGNASTCRRESSLRHDTARPIARLRPEARARALHVAARSAGTARRRAPLASRAKRATIARERREVVGASPLRALERVAVEADVLGAAVGPARRRGSGARPPRSTNAQRAAARARRRLRARAPSARVRCRRRRDGPPAGATVERDVTGRRLRAIAADERALSAAGRRCPSGTRRPRARTGGLRGSPTRRATGRGACRRRRTPSAPTSR